MANAASVAWQGSVPAETGQIIVQSGLGGDASRTLFGLATVGTGDNSTATVTINFIDGTKTLTFTPSAVWVFRVGGAGTATITVLAASAITNKECVITCSANLNAASFIFAVMLVK